MNLVHKVTLVSIFLLCCRANVFAQPELTMYRFGNSLPQANMLNAAFFPQHKVIIGLPVISSVYGSFSTDGVSFKDFFRTTATDSLAVDTVGLPGKFKKVQHFKMSESVQLFYFGLRMKRSYFSLALHQVFDMQSNIPGDLLGWAVVGPNNPRYSGHQVSLNDTYARSLAYNQISLSYAREVTEKLRLGARFKYLMGIAGGETEQVSGSLGVSIDSVTLRSSTLTANTAGADFFSQSNLTSNDYSNYFLKNKNTGIAVDLSATYQLTPRTMISASLNDLGYINWKDYTHSYQVNPITYSFKGIDLLSYINQPSSGSNLLQKEVDSLKNLATVVEKKGGEFKTPLTAKFYAGITHELIKGNSVSGLVYLDLLRGQVTPAFSAAYNIQLGRSISATLSASYRDGSFSNIGAGIMLRLGTLQVYATSDRFTSFFYPARASSVDGHVGVNFVFGNPNKKDKEKKDEKKDSVAQTQPVPIVKVQDSVVVKKDSVIHTPQRTEQPDSTKKESPVVEKIPDPVIAAPIVPVEVAPREETVKRGNNPDELEIGYYVIVGSFKNKGNAAKFSRILRAEDYPSNFGFLSLKQLYYVYSFKSKTDLSAARAERDRLRQITSHEFPNAWVLTVEK